MNNGNLLEALLNSFPKTVDEFLLCLGEGEGGKFGGANVQNTLTIEDGVRVWGYHRCVVILSGISPVIMDEIKQIFLDVSDSAVIEKALSFLPEHSFLDVDTGALLIAGKSGFSIMVNPAANILPQSILCFRRSHSIVTEVISKTQFSDGAKKWLTSLAM